MTRPNITIPSGFAENGVKTDFQQEKLQNGFDSLNPDVLAGDNLNKFIDDTYKGLNGILDLYNGIVLHEMTTLYDNQAVVGKFEENNFKLYRSLVNENLGHDVKETQYWEELKLGGGGSGSGFSLFDTRTLDYELPFEQSEGWALQGTYVYKEGVTGSRYGYPDFYAECVNQKENATATETTLGDNTITMYINGNGHQFYDIADKDVVDIFYNSMGVAWFYGIDTENERVFLPRNDYFAVTGGVIGNGMTIGLTDGTSNYGLSGYQGATTQLIGSGQAFGKEVGSGNASPYPANKSLGLITDPTKSGITLEPDENKYLYICVGNTNVQSAVTNITEITTSENDTLPLFHNFYSQEDMTTTGAYVNASLGSFLSGNVYATAYNELVNKLGTDNVKAITDDYTDYDFVVNQDEITFRLPLLSGDRVLVEKKEATADDTTWYNLYNDGWCEQGGQVNSSASGTVTLPKSYVNTNYSLVGGWTSQGSNSDTGGFADALGLFEKTTNNFKYSSVSGYQFTWEAKGYTDIPTNTGINLYYKVANAVENLEILDVAKVMKEAVLRSSLVEADSHFSGVPMPSNKYIDLTAGASDTQYTAPANGWFVADSYVSGNYIVLENKTIGGMRSMSLKVSNTDMVCYLPVSQGDVVRLGYGGNWTPNSWQTKPFRFYYAKGEV